MYNSDLPNRKDLPTTNDLLRSTAIAIVIAGALLITVILPAEYGIDPTRIGRLLGVTQMGEIKVQLAAEAERGDPAGATIETAIVDAPPAVTPAPSEPAPATVSEPEIIEQTVTPAWSDEVSVTLRPGEAAEIKLVMSRGAVAQYEWTASEGHLNSDLHGDGLSGQSTSYRKGRAETGDAGDLTAKFDGSHGWFWRNRSDETVTMTLRVNGAYEEIKRVI